jgi:hypothetical protein
MDSFKERNNRVLYIDNTNRLNFPTYSLMTRLCPRYVRVMDLWEYLLRCNANRDRRGELFIWRKTATNWQEKHQGVKHRKSKEKDIFVANNSSLLQVNGYLPYTYVIFFPKICVIYCCIKNCLNFYYVYNSK